MSVFCVGMIYIPLCLYLYYAAVREPDSYGPIYIPLCLYLYNKVRNLLTHAKRNLHSTMFIFIWVMQNGWWQEFQLYIPLCLYLYFMQNLSKPFANYLYIPLCLYLYSGHDDWQCDGFYLYIPLCLYLYPGTKPVVFPVTVLHSTMFIFIYRFWI